MRRLFGTDGIRGVANIEPMTGEMAMKIGRAAAYIFKNKTGRHRIVIGKDTRLSGYMLESALTSGICSMGGGCASYRAAANTRDCLCNKGIKGRCRRGDLCLA